MNTTDVLFATDFSSASQAAGRVAKEMTRQWGTRLHLVHVVPLLTDAADAAERLTGLAGEAKQTVHVETALLSGRVAHEIIRYARDKRIGLIVLGTHGRTGVSRALLGSVAESVVRLSPCPVLTVPPATADATATTSEPGSELEARHCLVCRGETDDLICEPCRTRIRGEALERKMEAERTGRRGSPR